ncbi:hypothetical protein B0O80DRAFT_216560 [Mortierella sp. GBAus27b]|nr:hypothetical protein BGX31_007807 [Mortierella sp. GBA43]KAI8347258.1 hypothetical protein B0O80DRAFT_216560 [Mortierella sp. GBAus27b]
MFARQVDPLADYNSAISAAEQHHRAQQEAVDQDSGLFTDQPLQCSIGITNSTCGSGSNSICNGGNSPISMSHNPYKRKHPFQFEQEFIAALDSSLEHTTEDDNSQTTAESTAESPWPTRPMKRAKKSTQSLTVEAVSPPLHDSTSPKVSPKLYPATLGTSSPTETTATATSFTSQGHNDLPSLPSISRKRPPSRSSASPSPLPHGDISQEGPPFRQYSSGPSIIDLSSGEELVTLQLGDNEHKRRSENDLLPPSGSPDSLQEVFECLDDGTLLPIPDHCPTYASPAKKVRLSKINNHPVLRHLKDEGNEDGASEDSKKAHNRKAEGACRQAHSGFWSGTAARRKGSTFVRNTRSSLAYGFWDDLEMDGTLINDHDPESEDHETKDDIDVGENNISNCDHKDKEHQGDAIDHDLMDSCTASTSDDNAGLQALVPYQKSKVILVSANSGDYDRTYWRNLKPIQIIPPEETKGKELVLYQKSPFAIYSERLQSTNDRASPRDDRKEDAHPWIDGNEYLSTVHIEELEDDDDGNMADDEECELSDDAPLVDLEDRIMDMDLD